MYWLLRLSVEGGGFVREVSDNSLFLIYFYDSRMRKVVVPSAFLTVEIYPHVTYAETGNRGYRGKDSSQCLVACYCLALAGNKSNFPGFHSQCLSAMGPKPRIETRGKQHNGGE